MTTRNLQAYSRQPNGETWADPLQPDYTIRFKTTSSPKMLDGDRTTNFTMECIVNQNAPVVISGSNTTDALSVRIRTSGSIESKAQLEQMLSDACAQLVASWIGENVVTGFPVATTPYRTIGD